MKERGMVGNLTISWVNCSAEEGGLGGYNPLGLISFENAVVSEGYLHNADRKGGRRTASDGNIRRYSLSEVVLTLVTR